MGIKFSGVNLGAFAFLKTGIFLLQQEGEMPIHELLNLYGYGGGSPPDEDEEEEEEEPEEEEDDDEDDEEEDLDNDESSRSTGELKRSEVWWTFLSLVSVTWFQLSSQQRLQPFCVYFCFQADGVKNSSGQGDEAQTTSEGRTRSVRSLGTAELIRPQKLKYFESMYRINVIFFLFLTRKHCRLWYLLFMYCFSGNNDAEEESDEDEDYVPSEDWKKVCKNSWFMTLWLIKVLSSLSFLWWDWYL